MAFPSNSKFSLSYRWEAVKNVAGTLKNKCNAIAIAGTLSRKQVLDFGNYLADCVLSFDNLTANAVADGLVAYAQQQENDPGLDVVANYSAMRSAIVSAQDWLVANFPRDAANNLVVFANFDANKRYSDIALTTQERTAFQSQVSSIAATIA